MISSTLRKGLAVAALTVVTLATPTAAHADDAVLYVASPGPDAVISGTSAPIVIHNTGLGYGVGANLWWIDGKEIGWDVLRLDNNDDYSNDEVTFLADTTKLADGPHVFEYRGYFEHRAQREFVVRNVAPTVSFANPRPGTTISGAVTVRVNAMADPQGPQHVVSVEFFLDGKSLGDDQLAPFDVDLDTRKISNGPHQLSARATDSVGLVGAATVAQVDVENLTSSIAGAVSHDLISAGSRVRVAASLSSVEDGRALRSRRIVLYARRGGQTGWGRVAAARTDSHGRASLLMAPRFTTSYRWRFDGDANHGVAVSRPVTVHVAPKLRLRLSALRARVGSTVTGTLTITPSTGGQPLALLVRRAGGRWTTLATGYSGARWTDIWLTLQQSGTFYVRMHRYSDSAGSASDSNVVRLVLT